MDMGVNRRHRVFVPQLAIRHCLEIELLYLPKSENEEHIKTKGGLILFYQMKFALLKNFI
ncbi:TPA: hypothetical protein IXS67_001575 [Enterococcus faecium]|nr:hypothetical protein [Enterococcus faecium]